MPKRVDVSGKSNDAESVVSAKIDITNARVRPSISTGVRTSRRPISAGEIHVRINPVRERAFIALVALCAVSVLARSSMAVVSDRRMGTPMFDVVGA
jgi:hypothetical protein